MEENSYIKLKGVTTNNLKNIDVEIPLGAFTVVTGKSGSGKSSLVFDTLYGESYRRYVESLSSFARQYLKALPKPQVAEVANIPAAIAVKQSKAGQNNRSTVGTLTELDDLMRLIFARGSDIFCCGHPVKKENGKSITEFLFKTHPDKTLMIMASMSLWERLKAKELKEQLASQGFTRAWVNGQLLRIEDTPAKSLKTGYVVLDRIRGTKENYHRCMESCELALKLGRGQASILADDGEVQSFSKHLLCPDCSRVYREPSVSLFNFNNPLGACEDCQGFGRSAVLDHDKIIPNLDDNLDAGGVAPWNFGQHTAYISLARNSARANGIDPRKAFRQYTEDDWEWLYNGDSKGSFKGIQGYFSWLDRKKYKAHYRIHSARFHSYICCETCQGMRLKPEVLNYRVLDKNFSEIGLMTLASLKDWLLTLEKSYQESGFLSSASSLQEVVTEALMRLEYLNKIGVQYLNLQRASKTLSGGEVQRINMARSLGSQLTGTLFCLDEPSAGLHPRDSHNLIDIIKSLRQQGNTVVVVEHEKSLMESADHVLEIGPEAGYQGGDLVYQGPPAKLPPAVTVPWSFTKFTPQKKQVLTLKGARTHNLRDITVSIPINALTVVCGVSGSGKTSLVRHTLYPALAAFYGKVSSYDTEASFDSIGPESLIEVFEDIFLMSQEPIGRSTRSNIGTYLGIYGEVRKLFAETPKAQGLSLKPGYFSFNVPGGRCEDCKGLGQVEEDLSFLGNMNVTCPSCQGLRFQESALDIRYRDHSLLDILGMTVTEARTFFFDQPKIAKILDLVLSVGLGYVTLGQNTSSFSGGEGQRLKILSFLLENKDGKPRLFIFDEPTTGLSDRDVWKLLEQFRMLLAKGHTVIVVEHHLGVIKSSDWVVELGPEAAEAGGQLVFQGPPQDLEKQDSVTAKYLKLLSN